LFFFAEGSHRRLHDKLGSHPCRHGGADGAHFAVWAPNARAVSVVGAFNGWDPTASPLAVAAQSGIWTGFVAGASQGSLYKYRIDTGERRAREKSDPFAFHCEQPPRTASVVWNLDYQ